MYGKKMGNRFFYLKAALLLLLLFLSGCPYESDFPLSGIKQELDPVLIGTWRSPKTGQADSGTLVVVPFNDRELLLIVRDEGEADVDLYRAFGSRVRGKTFLNVQEINLSAKARPWWFVHYAVNQDKLTIKIVEDTLFSREIGTPRALRAFIGRNLFHPELFSDNRGQILIRDETE